MNQYLQERFQRLLDSDDDEAEEEEVVVVDMVEEEVGTDMT